MAVARPWAVADSALCQTGRPAGHGRPPADRSAGLAAAAAIIPLHACYMLWQKEMMGVKE